MSQFERVPVRALLQIREVLLPSTTLCVATLVLAVLPIAVLFWNGVDFFQISPEYVVYRVGDALSVMFGETDRHILWRHVRAIGHGRVDHLAGHDVAGAPRPDAPCRRTVAPVPERCTDGGA